MTHTGRIRVQGCDFKDNEKENVFILFLPLYLRSPISLTANNRYLYGVRQGDPLKPDVTIRKYIFEAAYAETKSSKDKRSLHLFVEDQWSLMRFAKDTIDENLRNERVVMEIPCLQVFARLPHSGAHTRTAALQRKAVFNWPRSRWPRSKQPRSKRPHSLPQSNDGLLRGQIASPSHLGYDGQGFTNNTKS
ncbi:hypothetical protein BCR41DRAFT_402481 [Lobosporangium transversale]|uniref:Uncharacterized protein n=1 Tax=Lobosporangium transversale TaxID=64571 RepID=A0A1Y2G559_9FUNG|nr:hypothetical protein BCR41DRAFT_402481 [Lobosporangium transversale]ORY94276.1 hypothetical protein BCR41DRAFT_402481 [Lobosporangium transversale]|eukprot:XP_021875219.1 hypothetical protein BCR41DRAFT_402481 [Lobosporangium transversale]